MIIKDFIYGDEEITEDVLIELINSPAMQRLKGISQLGIPEGYDRRTSFYRFEHSLGVLILLRRLGADIKEQIAGLLHDVSHTAFSHVIDWIFGDPSKEDYQDNAHKGIIESSDIPEILARHGFDYLEIADPCKFSLLETPAPSLCVDRLDYSLRELKYLGYDELVNCCVNDLVNVDGQIAFRTAKYAEEYSQAYSMLQKESWGSIDSRTRYHILSQTLKEAIELGIINKEDLMKTDQVIIDLLEKEGTENIKNNLALLKNGFRMVEDENGIELKKKARFIDPEILIDGDIVKLSDISEDYKNKLAFDKISEDKPVRILIFKLD